MDYEELESAYQMTLAELEACKLELRQVQGNYKNLLNNAGQDKAEHEQRRRENEELRKRAAYYRNQVDSVYDAVMAIGGTWAMDSGGGVRIVPPDMEEMEARNVGLANELESTKAQLEDARENLSRAIVLADEIRKLQDLKGGAE